VVFGKMLGEKMAGFCGFWRVVSNAPRGALDPSIIYNFMLVKIFSKTGRGKKGGRVKGWNDLFL
jgi:hypothetical protein